MLWQQNEINERKEKERMKGNLLIKNTTKKRFFLMLIIFFLISKRTLLKDTEKGRMNAITQSFLCERLNNFSLPSSSQKIKKYAREYSK